MSDIFNRKCFSSSTYLVFGTVVHMSSCVQELANQSAVKSQKLKEVEEGLQLMVDKKSQLKEKTQEVDDLWNKHDTIEFEHRQEKELLKKEIECLAKDNKALKERNQSLQEKNKSIVKNHKGNSFSLLALDCSRVATCTSVLVLILVATTQS